MADTKSGKKVLFAGLGGGLDVVNASLLYFAAKAEGQHTAHLGSVRPAALSTLENHKPFATNGTWVDSSTIIHKPASSRYAEPLVSKYLQTPILFIGRQTQDPQTKVEAYSAENLKNAVVRAFETEKYDAIFFVDGGGDSLILHKLDSPDGKASPFKGGDAELLGSIRSIPKPMIQAIIAVGLDVKTTRFLDNINALKQRGGYFGRVNLRTGEKEDYTLGQYFSFANLSWLTEYFAFAEKILALEEKDLTDSGKMMSHTAVVTYHALKGAFGARRTFVPWEPKQPDGSLGVSVLEEHCWMYFVDPRIGEELKHELSGKSSL